MPTPREIIDAARKRGTWGADPSDHPPPPPDHLEKAVAQVSKPWGLIVGMITAAGVLVNIGVGMAQRNETYATKTSVEALSAKVDALSTQIGLLGLDGASAKITAANTNAFAAQEGVYKLSERVGRMERGIEGFNRAQGRPGRPTPIPIQQ